MSKTSGVLAGPFVRSPYNYDRNAASDDSSVMCMDKSLAQQSEKDECDINTIVRRFGLDGQVPSGVRMPTFGDFTGVNDFATAVNAIALAREAFDEMPAKVRARFGNDVEEFVEFCSDDKNRAEAESLGLVAPKEKPEEIVEAVKGARQDGGVAPA